MKALKAIWFTPWTNPLPIIGIVKGIDDLGNIKYYLGSAKGDNEEEDMNYILKWGDPIHPKMMREFFNEEKEENANI